MTTAYGPLAADEAKLRWHEPYVSEAINKKASAESYGVVRGFELQTDAGGADPKKFRIAVSSFHGDSVACVRDLNDGRTMTVNVATPIDVDLTALVLPANVYYVCLFVNYTLGAVTQVTVEVLTAAQMLNVLYAGKLVILGVLVYDGVTNLDTDPGSPNQATILVAVNAFGVFLGRMYAQLLESDYRVKWQNAIRNGDFDADAKELFPSFIIGRTVNEHYEWMNADFVPGSSAFFYIDDTAPRSGELHGLIRTPGVAALFQKHFTPAHIGDVVFFSGWFRTSVAMTNASAVAFGVKFVDGSGAVVAGVPSTNQRNLPNGAMAAYQQVTGMFRVPGGWDIRYMIPFIAWDHTDGVPRDLYVDDLSIMVLNQAALRPKGDEDLVGGSSRTTHELMTGLQQAGAVVHLAPWKRYVEGVDPQDMNIEKMRNPAIPNDDAGAIVTNRGFLGGSSPATGLIRRSAMYKENVVRAHGNATDPIGGPGPYPCVMNDEFGVVNPVMKNAVVGQYDVTFKQALVGGVPVSLMNGITYTVVLTIEATVPPGAFFVFVIPGTKTVNGFSVQVLNNFAVGVDLPAGATMHFIVLGD